MTITFRCEHCRKEVKAPDSAAGKRGKCPYCGNSSYVPSSEKPEEIPLAPMNEEEERRRKEEERKLFEQERQIIAERGGDAEVPLEHRQDYKAEDLYHFVVNYCLDMSQSNLERAETHVRSLKKYGYTAAQAVDDFVSGKALEPALEAIPAKVLRGFLKQLREQVQPA
jgi:phage FluMu protein Com